MIETTKIMKKDLVLYPFEDVKIETLHIKREINEHGFMIVTGQVRLKNEGDYLSKIGDVVKLINREGKINKDCVIFYGIIKSIDLYKENDKYLFSMGCETTSYILDNETRRCSYQSIDSTYSNLVNYVVEKYKDININFKIEDKEIDDFTIQYNETDWDFIKRMASQLEVGLYPSFINGEQKISFGKPNINNNVVIDEKILSSRHNTKDNILECDFKSNRLLELGEFVIHRDIEYFVKLVRLKLTNDVLLGEYTIVTKEGLKYQKFENEEIRDAILPAKVRDVSGEKVKVSLVDFKGFENEESGYWFSCSSVYVKCEEKDKHTIMPKIGDEVLIYNTY